MSRDLLTETIEATKDTSIVQVEGTSSMSYPPSYSSGSCPEAAGDITINQSIIDLGVDSASIKEESFTGETGLTLTLSETPIAAYDVEVFVNGVKQAETTDFSVSGKVVTLVTALIAADVTVVRYAYEVTS